MEFKYNNEVAPTVEQITDEIYAEIYGSNRAVIKCNGIVIDNILEGIRPIPSKIKSRSRYFYTEDNVIAFITGYKYNKRVIHKDRDGVSLVKSDVMIFQGEDVLFEDECVAWNRYKYYLTRNGNVYSNELMQIDMMTGNKKRISNGHCYMLNNAGQPINKENSFMPHKIQRFICFSDEQRKVYIYDTLKQTKISINAEVHPHNIKTRQICFPDLHTHCYGCFTIKKDMVVMPCGCVRYCKECVCDNYTCPYEHQCDREYIVSYAITNNNVELLQFMNTKYTKSMVSLAIQHGSVDVLKCMVESGVDIRNYIKCAEYIMERCVRVIDKIIDENEKLERSIFDTIERGTLDEVVERINQLESYPCDNDGKNLLRYAVERGDIGIVMLCAKKNNANQIDRLGVSPLSKAYDLERWDIVDILIQNNALDVYDHDEQMILKISRQRCNKSIALAVLKKV